MGRSPEFPPEAMNCNTPDTGNMEIPELLGTAEPEGALTEAAPRR
jgi:acyl-CoA dehydrogenase